LIFFTEVVIKMIAFGFNKFFHDPWNVFDFVVTIMVGIELAATYSMVDHRLYEEWSKYVSGDMLQILRLFRLLRLARVFKELGVLIQSFLMSLKALLWIFVLAGMWYFLCACVATVFIGRKEWLPNEKGDGVDRETIAELRARFQTIGLSLFALFEVMTLEGWTDYVRPMLASRLDMVVFFLTFIFVSTFFLLNLVTAVVVDRTLEAQQQQLKSESEDSLEKQIQTINKLSKTLVKLNNKRDIITREDFEGFLHNAKIVEYMKSLQWNMDFMRSMFSLIDHDNDGECSISRIQKLWVACHEPLDTSNYVRFQINLARRMEYQEKITLTVLHALEEHSHQKFDLTGDLKNRESFLKRSEKAVMGSS
jgi:voltage-gated sodium channel